MGVFPFLLCMVALKFLIEAADIIESDFYRR